MVLVVISGYFSLISSMPASALSKKLLSPRVPLISKSILRSFLSASLVFSVPAHPVNAKHKTISMINIFLYILIFFVKHIHMLYIVFKIRLGYLFKTFLRVIIFHICLRLYFDCILFHVVCDVVDCP